MKILNALITIACVFYTITVQAKETDGKLAGEIIGTQKSIDYDTNKSSTKVNTRECAFDGNLNTYFAAYNSSFAWVGLDLGEAHIITRIGWAPAHREGGYHPRGRGAYPRSASVAQPR